ncbi:MAG: helix-turn-helix domain-containing protein [Janthinobacterium lividum]
MILSQRQPSHPAARPSSLSFYDGGAPKNVSLPNWAELLTPLLLEVDRHFRRIAREEHTLLLAEMAAVAAKADEDDQVLNVQQTAELLGVRPQTVYEWIKAGKLTSFVIGRSAIRLKRGQVLATLQAQTQPDGRRKYARRINGAAKPKSSFAPSDNPRGKEVAYA